MADNNEIIDGGKGELLNIFTDEEDKKGTDLLAMTDFFEVFIGKIEVEMGHETAWEVFQNIEGFAGEIAAAIKGGFTSLRDELEYLRSQITTSRTSAP